jgi:hypothetical protein
VKSVADGSHIPLQHMLQRYLIFLDVINGFVEFSKTQPRLVIFVVHGDGVCIVLLSPVKSAYSEEVVAYKSLDCSNLIGLIEWDTLGM